jgi:hypothetical protein
MWRRVDFVRTDVSEGRIASIFRVEKSASEEPPAWNRGLSVVAEHFKNIHTRGMETVFPSSAAISTNFSSKHFACNIGVTIRK